MILLFCVQLRVSPQKLHLDFKVLSFEILACASLFAKALDGRATLAKMTLAKDLRLSCPQREWESDLLLLAAFKRPSQFQPSESRGLQPMTFESVEAREVEMSSLPLLSHHFSDLKQPSRLSCKCCDAIGTSLAQSIVIVKQISSMWNGVPNYSISACKNDSPPEILIWKCFRVVVVNEPTIDQHTYITVPFSCY